MKFKQAMFALGLVAAIFQSHLSPVSAGEVSVAPPRLNVLWLIAEDLGPHLACYGGTQVSTPNLDRLARDGVRFSRAFTTAPVCSTSRSAFMTGMYQTSIGAHHHRSHRDDGFRLPAHVRLLTEWFRDAGYTTLNLRELPAELGFRGVGKTDWNFDYDGPAFDSDRWSDLRDRQPFYAQLNFVETHRPFQAPPGADPANVSLPPYYPDHPVTRQDWAKYLDSLSELDRKVGRVLDRLAADGLAESTLVVFMADNGQAHVRGKQFCYDSGLHIPLIMRWPVGLPAPEHFQKGSVDDRLISAIDLAPTMLSLAGAKKPPGMEGRIFLGSASEPARDYVFSARDRCDETTFRFRTARDARYRYIRNFTPERPLLQVNEYKEKSYPVWNLLKELHGQDKLNPLAAALCAATMPPEELYDVAADPHETRNLLGEKDHAEALARLRAALDNWIAATRDAGAEPEPAELAARKGVQDPTTNPNKGYALEAVGPRAGK